MTAPVPSTVDLQGLRLRLWTWSTDSAVDNAADHAPVVLLLHGAMDTGRSWNAVATALLTRASCQVVAVDLRGHGQSDWGGPGASHHLLDFAKDTAAVIAWLEARGRPVHTLVGHSMGANVALLLAGAWPSHLRQLVLVDGVGPPPEDADEQPGRLGDLFDAVVADKRPFKPVASLQEAVERLQAWNPGLSQRGATRMAEPALVPRNDGRWDFPFDPRLRGPTPMRHPEAQWLAACDRLIKAGVGTAIVRATDGFLPAGVGDDALGEPCAERARRLQARITVVQGPHHLHVEAEDAVADAIASTLPRP